MKHALIVFVLSLHSTCALAQVHRCTMPDGKVVYSDTPCSSATKEAKTLVKSPPRAQSPSHSSNTKVEFTGPPQVDYIKASAILDNIRTLGRDCEWALKVDEKQLSKCVSFLAKLSPTGEFAQVTEHISRLNQDTATAEQNARELRRILGHMEQIVRYKEYAVASLGTK